MAKVELFLILKLFGSCKNYFKNHCKKHYLYRRKLAFFSVFLGRAAVAVCAGLFATLFCACGGGGGGGGIFLPVNEPDKNCCIVTAQNTAKTQINAQTLQILQNSGNNLTWLLEWYDQNNRKCSQNFPFDAKSFNLVLQNGNARPVLLYLLVNGKKYFYPAGAVFPNMAQSAGEAGQNIQLNLDFVNGVCAEVLADILQKNFNNSAEAEYFCNYFNWQKLAESIAKKKRPAFVDRAQIARNICSGTFSASSIKEKKTIKAFLAPASLVNWLICKDLQKAPLVSSDFLEILAENADYLSDKGFVFVQRLGDADNGLVITISGL